MATAEEGIISVVMAAMFVVAGAYLLSTIFIPSGEEYSIMAQRDIASNAKKIGKADSGDCTDFRIKIPSGFRINMEEKEIMIDIGFKSEGIIDRSEFSNEELPAIGEQVEVYVEHIEDAGGNTILSKDKLAMLIRLNSRPIRCGQGE